MPTRDIRTNIVLEGEQQYKRSLDEALQSVKMLGLQVKENATVYKTNSDSVEGNRERIALLKKEMEQQQRIIDLYTQKIEANRAAGEGNSKETQQLEEKLIKARTALAAMNNEMTSANGKLPSVGAKVKEVAAHMGEGLAKAAEYAAKATVAAMAAIGSACVAAGKAIYDLTGSAGQYADTIITMSDVTGIAAQDLMKWEYAGQFIDTSVETITGSMKKLSTNMYNMSDSTAETFKQLKISVTDSSGHLRSSEDVFWDVVDALGTIENATERDNVAMALLGKSATDLNPLINAGSAAFKQLGDEAAAAGLIMSDESLAAFGAYDDAVNVMKSTLTAAGRSIAEEFLPATQSVVEGVSDVVTAFVGMINGVEGSKEAFNEAINSTIGNVMNVINDLLPMILDAGVDIVMSIIDGLIQALPTLIDAAMTLIDRLVTAISDNLPKILDAGFNLLLKFIDGIVKAIPKLLAMLPTIIETIVNFITAHLPDIVGAAIEIVMSLIEGIISAIPQLVAAIPKLITAIIDTLTQNLPKILAEGVTILKSLIQGIIQAIPQLVAALPQVIKALINFITTNLPEIISTGIEILIALIQGIIEAIPQLIAALPQVVVAIVQGIGQAITKIPEVGMNIIKGLWEGIKSMASWLWDKLTGWVGDLLGGIKGLFGIHSPSSVMRDQVGKMIGLGLAEGIGDEADTVQKAFDDLMPDPGDFDFPAPDFPKPSPAARLALSSGVVAYPYNGSGASPYDLSDAALTRLSDKLVEAMQRAGVGEAVIQWNGREFGRTMRRGLEAGFI